MTARRTWKANEQRVSEFFGTHRTPLSGGSSRHTRSDSLSERLFIEMKLRPKHSAVTLWGETKKLADKEGKVPVVALSEKNRPGFWVLCHSSDLKKVAEEVVDD